MILSRALALATMLTALSAPAFAQSDDADTTPPAKPKKIQKTVASNSNYITRDQLPDLIAQTLNDHPEIITNSIKHLREKQQLEEQQKSTKAIETHKDELYNNAQSPSIGPKDADVTLVEFFDYHCGYCKHLLPTITQLVNEDKKVRVVFKDFPILSEDSVTASQAALAVNHIAPDKYFAYHTELMKYNGKFEQQNLVDIANRLGIDGAALKAEMGKPEIAAELQKNHELGEALGVRGTPALVMGNTMLPGALPYDELKKLVATMRAGKPINFPQYPTE